MRHASSFPVRCIALACLAGLSMQARADAVTDWNTVATELVVEAKLGTPPANRLMAMVQTAVHDAVAAALAQQPGDSTAAAAAVAAANRATLARLMPAQAAAIDAAYQAAIGPLADGPAKASGIAAGEQAAARVLTWRADDGAGAPDRYRPHALPGAYVPTAGVAGASWGQRTPWLMDSPSRFRPGAPPALGSTQWARDYNEIKAMGSKASTQRSAEQTEVARFWEYSLPPIYHALVRSAAEAPGRGVAQNARLFAAASQAMDDALIAVFDAKYHYGFWRPVTAIRNGDLDDNPATELDAGWTPLIDNPMHPEYPSAHSILAGALAEVLRAEFAGARMPALQTRSPSAKNAVRRWDSVDAFAREVGDARVWEGIHFRHSTEVGVAMGRQIGALAARQVAQAPASAGVPSALVPQQAKLVERLAARGVQIYECRADAAATTGAQWVFVAPQASLFDGGGAVVGLHDAGPRWEAADGSRIVGAVKARADAPQAGAIPWLLLSARSVGGPGRFAAVTDVQRVNTSGGTPPQRPCDKASVGQTDRVPYTADYLLYAAS